MSAPLLWVNGFPGSGKLTVMRVLTELLGVNRAVLIDNHQMIDPVEATTPREHPAYQRQRQLQREKVFKEYVSNPERASQIIIFTGKPLMADLHFKSFQKMLQRAMNVFG